MEIEKDKTEEERREIGEARKKTEKEWEVLSKEHTTRASTVSKEYIEKMHKERNKRSRSTEVSMGR